jgi:hypothetical protein
VLGLPVLLLVFLASRHTATVGSGR